MAIQFISCIIEGLDGSGKDGGVADIEFETVLFQDFTSLDSLLNTLIMRNNTIGGEFDISPASETILLVPAAFSVA